MTHALSALFSKKADHWSTPKDLLAELDKKYGPFTLDPCPLNGEGGLDIDWAGRVFVNPPYSNVGAWMKKARSETLIKCRPEIVVCLVPARTDTKWFHEYCYGIAQGPEIKFLKGRLKFGDSKNSAPFPSMLVIYRRLQ